MIFTVIVPTRNRVEKLKSCLVAIGNQDFPKESYEVRIVDDASGDGTADFLRSLKWDRPKLTYFSLSEGRGPAAARNLGARGSASDFLAFTDDDCSVPVNWLESLSSAFSLWPESGAVGGYLEAPPNFLENSPIAQLEAYETHVIYKAGREIYLGGFESPAGGTNNLAYRRTVFEALGGFDEHFPVPAGEDADLKFRAVEKGYKIGYIPLKVTHLDSYSWRSFFVRSILHGFGAAHFQEKRGRTLSSLTIARDLLSLPRGSLRTFFVTKNPVLALSMFLKLLFMEIGVIKYLKRRKSK